MTYLCFIACSPSGVPHMDLLNATSISEAERQAGLLLGQHCHRLALMPETSLG